MNQLAIPVPSSIPWRVLPLALLLVLGVDLTAQVRLFERAKAPGVEWAGAGGFHDAFSNLLVVPGANDLKQWHGDGFDRSYPFWVAGPVAVCASPWQPGRGLVWSPAMGTVEYLGYWGGLLASPGVPVAASAMVGRQQLQPDPANNQAILFVETLSPAATAAYAFTFFGWQPMPLPPGNDRFGGMVFDAARNSMFALTDAGGFLWDGAAWNAAPAPGGAYVSGRALAFDASRQRLVAFGGSGPSGVVAPTLEWDGTQWLTLAPATSPPPRRDASLIYDPVRQQCVLFGGRTSSTTTIDDVWGWDGAAWQNYSAPTTRPPALTEAMAADLTAGTFLFGGRNAAGAATNQTWRFDGTTWANVTGTGPAPSPRYGAAMVALTSDTILLFGGRAANGTVLSDTWFFTAAGGWTLHSSASGIPRYDAAICSDRAGRAWLFGGNNGGTVLEHMMQFSLAPGSATWQYIGQATSGLPREKCALAYDCKRDKVVLYGGRGPLNPALGATQEFDPATGLWTYAPVTTEPAPVFGLAMAYDTGKDRVVMAGGYDPTAGLCYAGTADWDGGTYWLPMLYSPRLALVNAAACYREATGRLFLFGGQSSPTGAPLDQTLELEDHYGPALLGGSFDAILDLTGLPAAGLHQTPLRALIYPSSSPGGGAAALFVDVAMAPQPFLLPPPLFCSSRPWTIAGSGIVSLLELGDPAPFTLPLPPMAAGLRLILQGLSLEASGCIDATAPLFVRVRSF